MKKIDAVADIPDALRAAYFEMQRCAVKARISQDGDYKKLKGSGLFEHLDKLWLILVYLTLTGFCVQTLIRWIFSHIHVLKPHARSVKL